MSSFLRSSYRPLALFLIASLSACHNPADDAQKAAVSEAEPAGGVAAGAAALTLLAESRIGFVGSKITGSHAGGFKSFSGTVELDADGQNVVGVKVEIDMTSTFSDDERLTGHLKSPDFFDVEKFPTATFVATNVATGASATKMPEATHTVTGNLTLHGVTKAITFAAKISPSGSGFAVVSEFAIRRQDFEIVYPGRPDDLIRDDVVIQIDVKAVAG